MENAYSALVERHARADEANNSAEAVLFETERSAPVMHQMAELMGEMDAIRQPFEHDVVLFDTKLSHLRRLAEEITLD